MNKLKALIYEPRARLLDKGPRPKSKFLHGLTFSFSRVSGMYGNQKQVKSVLSTGCDLLLTCCLMIAKSKSNSGKGKITRVCESDMAQITIGSLSEA